MPSSLVTNTMINIRDARTADAPLLVEAEKKITKTPGYLVSRPHELSMAAFEKKIESLNAIPNGKYVVAEKDGSMVGHAYLDPMGLDAIQHVVRLTIVIHRGFEEKGIGYLLMNHLIDWAKANAAIEKIELNVRASNIRAIRLYQKLGFNIEGRLRNRVKLPNGLYVDDLEMGLFVCDPPASLSASCLAVGKVVSSRKEASDDNWDSVMSYIEIDGSQFGEDALLGLKDFSHLEVIFLMNQVDVRKVESSARHPRNNSQWPMVGIFAQRAKSRPNQIGTTICRIEKIEGLKIWLRGLDAIDGSPVLDIKPWVKEFGPRGDVHQPEWITELMKEYWTV